MLKHLLVLGLFLLGLFSAPLLARSGFAGFSFGDSPQEVAQTGAKLCKFNALEKDPRWAWKARSSCEGFVYKGVRTKLYFEFVEDDLKRILVVSKDFPHYFLIRHPQAGLLIPLDPKAQQEKVSNLADALMVKDKVHHYGPGEKLTYYFYEGNWEWELALSEPGFDQREAQRMKDQEEDEQEESLEGWQQFKFGEEMEETKKKLVGLCANTQLKASTQQQGLIRLLCQDFPFAQTKTLVRFSFWEEELVRIDLALSPDYYDQLLPRLKEKYGPPFLELEKNPLYYPFIHFPKAGITLSYRLMEAGQVEVQLAYNKAGFVDKESEFEAGLKGKKTFAPTQDRLMDSL